MFNYQKILIIICCCFISACNPNFLYIADVLLTKHADIKYLKAKKNQDPLTNDEHADIKYLKSQKNQASLTNDELIDFISNCYQKTINGEMFSCGILPGMPPANEICREIRDSSIAGKKISLNIRGCTLKMGFNLDNACNLIPKISENIIRAKNIPSNQNKSISDNFALATIAENEKKPINSKSFKNKKIQKSSPAYGSRKIPSTISMKPVYHNPKTFKLSYNQQIDWILDLCLHVDKVPISNCIGLSNQFYDYCNPDKPYELLGSHMAILAKDVPSSTRDK